MTMGELQSERRDSSSNVVAQNRPARRNEIAAGNGRSRPCRATDQSRFAHAGRGAQRLMSCYIWIQT